MTKDEAISNVAEAVCMVASMKLHDNRFQTWEGKRLLAQCEKILHPLRTKLRQGLIEPDAAGWLADGVDLALEEFHCAHEIRDGVKNRNPSQVLFFMNRLEKSRRQLGHARSDKIALRGPIWDPADSQEERYKIAQMWANEEGIWTKD